MGGLPLTFALAGRVVDNGFGRADEGCAAQEIL
jgi:hypothetical protein